MDGMKPISLLVSHWSHKSQKRLSYNTCICIYLNLGRTGMMHKESKMT